MGGVFFKSLESESSRKKTRVSGISDKDDGSRKKARLAEEEKPHLKGSIDNIDSEDRSELKLGLDNTYEEVLSDISREHRDRKAVKSDDAAVPEYLWEEHLLEGLEDQEWDDTKLVKIRRVSEWLRSKMFRWWTRNVTRSYVYWAEAKYDLKDVKSKVHWVRWNGVGYEWTNLEGKDRWAQAEGRRSYQSWWKRRLLITHQDSIPAGDAIRRAAKSSWWAWEAGSWPFHWRWPKFYQETIRDGLKVHFTSPPPRYRKGQQDISDKAIKLQVIKKLSKARERGYIAPGLVGSLTAFFAVPKGKDNIRLVYDGPVSGLNLSIWVP
jgi:hypothetical protein